MSKKLHPTPSTVRFFFTMTKSVPMKNFAAVLVILLFIPSVMSSRCVCEWGPECDKFQQLLEDYCFATETNDVALGYVVCESAPTNQRLRQSIEHHLNARTDVKKLKVAARYRREHGKTYLGVCLGFQAMVVEYCRNVLMWKGADSTEVDVSSNHYLYARN